MKQAQKLLAVLCILLIAGSLFGCRAKNMPGKDVAEEHLQQDLEDLQFLVDWLEKSDYPYIVFDRKESTALIKFEHIPIPEEIRPVIKRLLEESYYIEIAYDREDHTISFEYWRSSHEQDCGIVYSLDDTMLPDVGYMTQCEPLSIDGWYYYFADYNKWRVGETTNY